MPLPLPLLALTPVPQIVKSLKPETPERKELEKLIRPWLPTWEDLDNPFTKYRGVVVVDGGSYENPGDKKGDNAHEASRSPDEGPGVADCAKAKGAPGEAGPRQERGG